MLVYDALDTPIGRLWIALSARGICRLSFAPTEEAFLAEMEKVFGETPLRDPTPASEARRQLEDYFDGRRQGFSLSLDVERATPFQRRVLDACAAIPYGETRTYADLAREAGRPDAARAVGNVMARNPLPILIPCHRVICSDGRLGEYGAGRHVKAYLLELESRSRHGRSAGAPKTDEKEGEGTSRGFFTVQGLPAASQAPGITRRAVCLDHVMLTFFEFEAGAVVAEHSHPHEQITYVVRGALDFTIDGEQRLLRAGEGACIPPNVPHSAVVMEPSFVIDGWSPVREDYRVL